MVTIKTIVLTALKYKGIDRVKSEVKDLAENAMCSQAYIHSIIKKVEKQQILIK